VVAHQVRHAPVWVAVSGARVPEGTWLLLA
jgi:hypothetical protein